MNCTPDYGGGGKSKFAREAEIVGPILLGGLLVFAALVFLCTCSGNRGGGRGDSGAKNVLGTIKDVRTEGGRGVGPKADIVREVAWI